jgi:vesicular inhibitory amino acid transporter
VLLAAALVVPTVLLPDLAALSSLSALSVGSAVAVGLALAALCGSGAAAGAAAAATRLVAPETLAQVLGCVAFVYAGHSTFPVVQQSMRSPSKAPRWVARSCSPGLSL